MTRFIFVHRPLSQSPATPFDSAEEAWFWYARCLKARRDGARFKDSAGGFQRPCEPDDIYRAVLALRRTGILSAIHIATLSRFGCLDRPPDARCEDEKEFVRPWVEALGRLTVPLKAKGIVA